MKWTSRERAKLAKKNWFERIAEAQMRYKGDLAEDQYGKCPDGSVFTWEDRAAAEDWITCACGMQDPRIPRRKHDRNGIQGYIDRPGDAAGAPLDPILVKAGVTFSEAVADDNISEAALQLVLIEARSSQILTKVIAKKRAKK